MKLKASLPRIGTAWPGIVSFLVAALCFREALAAETTGQTNADRPFAHPSVRDLRIHDPSSIIQCRNEYWHFATGMGIISRRSKEIGRAHV